MRLYFENSYGKRRIIAEPTAAILASNIDMEKGGKYMVVDYGGSTLDFSIADISDNVVEILASNGDVYCGGSDLDKILAQYIVDEFKSAESGYGSQHFPGGAILLRKRQAGAVAGTVGVHVAIL